MFYFLLLLLLTTTTTVIGTPCNPGCTIAEGRNPDECKWYIDNDDWLPPNYAYATNCVCTDESLDYPSVNCVRKRLQELHQNEFSKEFKQQAREYLDDLRHLRIGAAEYRAWTDMAFANKVRGLHVTAFQECCCPGTPASAYFWHAIFDWSVVPPCFAIREGQHLLSSCGCTGN